MKLKKFIKKYVCPNTLVKLWVKENGHKKMVGDVECEVLKFMRENTVMEWKILNGERMKKYANCKVVGITDILCDDYIEAVNIVIEV